MMAPKSFSSGLVTLCLSIILPCLALSSILELAFKNVAPKRPDNWNDLVARPLGAKTLYTRSIGGTVWWPQNMFPDEVGILNASSGMALVTVFIVSVLAICARRSGPAGVRYFPALLRTTPLLTVPVPKYRQQRSGSPSSSSWP